MLLPQEPLSVGQWLFNFGSTGNVVVNIWRKILRAIKKRSNQNGF